MSSGSSASSSPTHGDPLNHNSRPFPPFRAPQRSRRQNVDYGIRNSLAHLRTRELHGLDVYRWEDDDLSLRSAAAQARLPYDRMTKRELELFPELARVQASTALFLYVRNRSLVQWHLDPLVELTVDALLAEMPEPFNSDVELVSGVHAYLQRYGYINYGIFHQLSHRALDRKRLIVVVGAGASGLAAARQLRFFGFDVIVLEGRNRSVGGRAMLTTKRQNLPQADMGAMIVTGTVGNPLVTIIQQTPVNVVRISRVCPIYDQQGKLVNCKKDDLIQRSFNRILGTLAYITHGMQLGDENIGRKISLGEAFEHVINQQELRVQVRRHNYWKKYNELCKQWQTALSQIQVCKDALKNCLDRLRENGIANPAEATHESIDINFDENVPEEEFQRQFTVRCLRQCMEIALKKYDEAEAERVEIESVLMDFRNMEPSHVYMNNMDKRILDFHLANLEYAIGAPLTSVALKDWDQDDPYGFPGSHMTVTQGLGHLVSRLAIDLDVRLSHVVRRIGYDQSGATVEFYDMRQPPPEANGTAGGHKKPEKQYLKADAVLCTAPLGVLKRSLFVADDNGETPGSGAIQFEPALPRWKREAISNLGFGSLNKLILFFEKPFWDTSKGSFGRLNETPGSRGELYLFYSNGNLPFLTGLFAGESASNMDRVDEKIIVQKAMQILHSIFGNSCPVEPLHYQITRWHKEKFSCGCYSYMSMNSSPEDYDTLGLPLHPGDDQSQLARVFFAGEHTNRQHPATVHGAFLSGLREAARIADTFIGPLSPSGEKTVEVRAHTGNGDKVGDGQRNGTGESGSEPKKSDPIELVELCD